MKILYGLLFHHHFYNSFNRFEDLIYELSMVSVKFLYLPFSVTMAKAFVFSLLRPQVYQSCSEVLLSRNSPSFLLTKDTSINFQIFAERHQNAFKNVQHSSDFQQVFSYLNNFYLPEFEPGKKRFCLFMSYSNKSLSIYVHKSVTSFESPILKQESRAFCFCLVFNVESGLPHLHK